MSIRTDVLRGERVSDHVRVNPDAVDLARYDVRSDLLDEIDFQAVVAVVTNDPDAVDRVGISEFSRQMALGEASLFKRDAHVPEVTSST